MCDTSNIFFSPWIEYKHRYWETILTKNIDPKTCRIYSFTSVGVYINLRQVTDPLQDVTRDFRNNETNVKLVRRDKIIAPRQPAAKNGLKVSRQNESVSYNLHQSFLSKINSNSSQLQ